ncbi:MAG: ABC transporter substrate-binding protein, partial [Clostridia bacterium]
MDTIQTQLGIPAVFIEADMAHMDHCYEMLGDLLGEQEAARTLSDYCNRIYTNTEQTMAAIGAENRIRLLYCLGEDGQSVIAKGSYHAEVLDMLCNNLAVVEKPSSNAFGNPVDFEQLYQWDPDVILFAPDSVYARAGDDPLWQQMKAIAGETYYEVPSGPFNWMGFPPSVNRYMGMIWLSELLYPEMFSYDLLEETRQYYQLFYHIDLTRD